MQAALCGNTMELRACERFGGRTEASAESTNLTKRSQDHASTHAYKVQSEDAMNCGEAILNNQNEANAATMAVGRRGCWLKNEQTKPTLPKWLPARYKNPG
jgi:hypothetical protein